MTASVELKTGQRRLINYILEPLAKLGSESLRDR